MFTVNQEKLDTIELDVNAEKAQRFIYRYNHARNNVDRTYLSVSNFYRSPSQYKLNSERDIKRDMFRCGGWGYYVTGGNSCCYSAGWLVCDSNHQIKLIYETKAHRYSIDYNYSVVIE